MYRFCSQMAITYRLIKIDFARIRYSFSVGLLQNSSQYYCFSVFKINHEGRPIGLNMIKILNYYAFHQLSFHKNYILKSLLPRKHTIYQILGLHVTGVQNRKNNMICVMVWEQCLYPMNYVCCPVASNVCVSLILNKLNTDLFVKFLRKKKKNSLVIHLQTSDTITKPWRLILTIASNLEDKNHL